MTSEPVTPAMLAAAWGAWHERHGGKLGHGPAFAEAIKAALAARPTMPAGEPVATPGPYEARLCKGMPTDVCDYGVVSLSKGREVCRVWEERDARAIAALLNSSADLAASLHGENGESFRLSEIEAQRQPAIREQARNETLHEIADWIKTQRAIVPANGWEFEEPIRALAEMKEEPR